MLMTGTEAPVGVVRGALVTGPGGYEARVFLPIPRDSCLRAGIIEGPQARLVAQLASATNGFSCYEEESNVIPEPVRIDELPWELKVNGIPVQSVQIRSVPASDDFQILMTDPQLGRFSLTSAFELEIREQDSWQPLTLEQLTRTLTERSEFLQAEDLPKASEMAERRLLDRLDAIDIPHRRSPRLSELTGHDECVRQVQKLLHEARVPHRIAGTVFVVPSALKARIVLRRAGFRPSPISPAALIEPLSGCAVQLVERRT